ncbi:MAG: hypothetical protein IJM44_03600 [Ruminococcus sp.]|nr:hypothetical protein [Ruminococcus sp.]
MTNEIYNAAASALTIAAGIMLLAALSKARELYDDYTEWATLRRRAKYRAPAYTDMEQRWTQHQNREQLWKAVNR